MRYLLDSLKFKFRFLKENLNTFSVLIFMDAETAKIILKLLHDPQQVNLENTVLSLDYKVVDKLKEIVKAERVGRLKYARKRYVKYPENTLL